MLTIKKIDSMDEIQAYFEKEQLNHTITAEQFMGFYDGDTLCGIGSIELKNTKVYMNFLHISGGDMPLYHGLAKALLNMADLRGIQTVYGSNPDLDKLYGLLRFQKTNEEYSLSLENYFTVHEHE